MKIVIEEHIDGYVAYPVGIKGIVMGEGDTYEEALADVKSAIQSTLKPLAERSLKHIINKSESCDLQFLSHFQG